METVVRPAEYSNVCAISKLFAASWKYAYADIINPEYLRSLSDEHWISFLQTGLSEQKIDCLIIENDNEIVGASIVRKSLIERFPHDGELVCLYLLPEQIGKGIGHILITGIEELMRSKGYTHCILDVLTENQRAKNFYKMHGFEEKEFTTKTILGNQELECSLMRKVL
jgi:ribosomal protein S18 acetylase RimI-like enzyme